VRRNKVVSCALFSFVILALVITPIYAQTYTRSWTVTVTRQETFLFWSSTKIENKTITITIDKATYDYWRNQRLQRYGEAERFRSYLERIPYYKWLVVTGAETEPVKQLVTQLKALGLNETNYVNAVSQMVAQMIYAYSPAKFAVETMVDGRADCDGFSVFVATILKASGYQVVLFMYRKAQHAEAGVHLETKPYSLYPETYPIMWLNYSGERYYPLECTSQNPNWGWAYWRVGMVPTDLVDEFRTAVYVVRI